MCTNLSVAKIQLFRPVVRRLLRAHVVAGPAGTQPHNAFEVSHGVRSIQKTIFNNSLRIHFGVLLVAEQPGLCLESFF